MAEDDKGQVEKVVVKHNSFAGLMIAGIIGGIIAMGGMVGYQHYVRKPEPSIIALDIEKVVNHKRQILIKKYAGAYTDENAQKAEREVNQYMGKVKEGLTMMAGSRVILASTAVLGGAEDITEQLIEYAEDIPAESPGSKNKLKWNWPKNEP